MFSANTSQVSNDVKYIEDFFSAWLRTGTGSSQTVTTGIKENTGALVISKSRSAATDWAWYDTFRGATKDLASNTTAAETTQSQGLTAFNTDGHTWGTLAKVNTSGATYVDFVLKPTPKFFDVVTWTGNMTARTISHNLGSVPGCIIVKSTNGAGSWYVYHRSVGNTGALRLNLTNVVDTSLYWNNTTPTSTSFTVGADSGVNANSTNYVAYLFAHDAGGFGLAGTDNVVSCGTFTTNGSEASTTDLGYEPQWLLLKAISGGTAASQPWHIFDSMRGLTVAGQDDASLQPNNTNAESQTNRIGITSNGFTTSAFGANTTFIYVAVRRGPMKVPTDATKVFVPSTYTGAGTSQTVSSGLQTAGGSLVVIQERASGGNASRVYDTLRGPLQEIYTQTSNAEVNRISLDAGLKTFNMNGFSLGSYNYNGTNQSSLTYVGWQFRRAPGFFDEVCYTGTGSATTVTHNLGVAPELMIVKRRNSTGFWAVYTATTGAANVLELQSTAASTSGSAWNSTAPTSSVFSVGNTVATGASGGTYVAYLFASCPGVSKVGSYTGNGSGQNIDCGFTAGARFVLIKRTDSTGDWYVYDTARGMTTLTDPYLLLNSTAAESATLGSVTTVSGGFAVNASILAAINTNAASYIYLAIA